ncbi:MAG: hypothetical protein IJG61_08150, partial [Lachnospiraceae bacterium]|nr:hypothetical protein [Lachnospiraceae bacterium]
MKKQYAMVVEADRCLGCHACQVACKFENDIALGTSRVRTYTMGPVGEFPNSVHRRVHVIPRSSTSLTVPRYSPPSEGSGAVNHTTTYRP